MKVLRHWNRNSPYTFQYSLPMDSIIAGHQNAMSSKKPNSTIYCRPIHKLCVWTILNEYEIRLLVAKYGREGFFILKVKSNLLNADGVVFWYVEFNWDDQIWLFECYKLFAVVTCCPCDIKSCCFMVSNNLLAQVIQCFSFVEATYLMC